jgi:hypothetical protein
MLRIVCSWRSVENASAPGSIVSSRAPSTAKVNDLNSGGGKPTPSIAIPFPHPGHSLEALQIGDSPSKL